MQNRAAWLFGRYAVNTSFRALPEGGGDFAPVYRPWPVLPRPPVAEQVAVPVRIFTPTSRHPLRFRHGSFAVQAPLSEAVLPSRKSAMKIAGRKRGLRHAAAATGVTHPVTSAVRFGHTVGQLVLRFPGMWSFVWGMKRAGHEASPYNRDKEAGCTVVYP